MTDFSAAPDPHPARREPMFNIPAVILILGLAMAAIHGWRDTVSDTLDGWVLSHFALVPGRVTFFFDQSVLNSLLARVAQGDPQALGEARAARYFLQDGPAPWSFLTHAFLHGDWTHFGLNALWLTAFGSAVARRFGAARFLIFFAVCAVAGGLAHLATHLNDFAPMIGASGAVSGAMAAAARFAFQPGAPLGEPKAGIARDGVMAWRQPALTLAGVITDRRTLMFLGVWFIVNFVFGIASQPLGVTQAAIAWEAHAGGFAAGFLLFGLFDRAPRAMAAR